MRFTKSALLNTFKKKVQRLRKKVSKFSYGINLFSGKPLILESFLDEAITFQPIGKGDIDVPLSIQKAPKVLREAIEYLFDISIQEDEPQQDGNFYGICYHDKELKSRISFSLYGLSEDSERNCYVIELPEPNFDFKAKKSIYNQLFQGRYPNSKYTSPVYSFASDEYIDSLAYSFNSGYIETYNFREDNDYSTITDDSESFDFTILKEFVINKHITLKLIHNEVMGSYTKIFVNNIPFLQCAYILLKDPQNNESQSEINSIDEAAEKLDSRLELPLERPSSIPPETLFWAHCSNLQTWAENGYDTRILHSNLAFPLLKKLVEVGDHKARKVFSEEIAKRILSQYPPVLIFLLEEGYLDYLDDSELRFVLEELIAQINKPHSKLIDVNLAKSLLNLSRKYLEEGSDRIQLLLKVYAELNKFLVTNDNINNKFE